MVALGGRWCDWLAVGFETYHAHTTYARACALIHPQIIHERTHTPFGLPEKPTFRKSRPAHPPRRPQRQRRGGSAVAFVPIPRRRSHQLKAMNGAHFEALTQDHRITFFLYLRSWYCNTAMHTVEVHYRWRRCFFFGSYRNFESRMRLSRATLFF